MKKVICIILAFTFTGFALKAQEFKLLRPAQSTGSRKYDMFGWQVCMGKDFMFASAPFEDRNSRDAGTIYVYQHKDGEQALHQVLSLSDTSAITRLGLCMAHSGDYLLASTQYILSTKAGKGNLHLFKRGADDRFELVYSFPSDSTGSMSAPSALALEGNTIVVANGCNMAKYPNGLISVFTINSDNRVSLQQRITIANLNNYDVIGRKVALNNGLLAFSCTSATGAAKYSGAVWVYKKDASGNWNYYARLIQPDGESYDKFGSSLAVDYPTVVVGAMRQGTNTTNGKKCGAVYVYRLNANGFTTEAKLSADFAANDYDYFGTSVSLHRDILAVGASADDFAGDNTGAVYVFQRNGNSWQQVNKLIGSNVNSHARFGHSVAVYDGDVLCSAHLEETDTGAQDHGSVYLFKNAKVISGIGQTGANGSSGTRLAVYPNPIRDRFELELPTGDVGKSIIIYDVKGAVVTQLPAGNATHYTINCADWKPGIYVISVKGADKVDNLQIVKP